MRTFHRAVHAAAREQILVAMLGIPALLRHPVWREVDPDEGAGLGVVLVPGFGFGDRSLTLTRNWLRARGYRPASAGVGLNVGCTNVLLDRLERSLEQHAERTERRVVLLGQSRGGGLARLVAVRRPDLVRAVVMLGSPVLDPLGGHPNVVRVAFFLARLSAAGMPGLLGQDCLSGDCFRTNSAALTVPLPPNVPGLAIYSRSDAIAPWRLCLDPWAECVEIASSHTGMGLVPAYFSVLGPRLTQWTDDTKATSEVGRSA